MAVLEVFEEGITGLFRYAKSLNVCRGEKNTGEEGVVISLRKRS